MRQLDPGKTAILRTCRLKLDRAPHFNILGDRGKRWPARSTPVSPP